MQEHPFDLGPHQEVLRQGKEQAARRQASLDDPEGAAIVQRVGTELEKAILDGRSADADTFAATLRTLLDAEDALRAKGAVSDATERALRVTISAEQDRRNGST